MANHQQSYRVSGGASIGDLIKIKSVEESRQKAQKAKTARVDATVGIDLVRTEVTVLRVVVTPDVAKQWLEHNVANNRIVSSKTIEGYSRDMKAGHWDVNGEPIKFTTKGELIDGQHRLHACVRAGVNFETVVVLGLDPRAMRTLDNGLTRRTGDVLSMTRPNAKPPHKVAAAIQMVWRYEQGRLLGKEASTRDEAIECLDRHPGVMDSIVATQSNKLAPAAMLVFCHYLFSTMDKVLAEVFFNALETGTNLHGDEPVFLLRERLAQNRASRAKLSTTEQLALTFKAWNLTRDGKKVKALRWNLNSGEDFPQVEGPRTK